MRVLLVGVLAAVLALPATAGAATTYGDLEFPRDEHQHPAAWDYWWGAANLKTKKGNRYTVGIGYLSVDGVGASGQQVFPHQGPYKHTSILTEQGPADWGHPEQHGQFVRNISRYVPGVSELMSFETLDARDGMKMVDRWERTTLDREAYRFRIDNAAADVHPSGERIRLVVDMKATMKGPPLLAGGKGTWWYGIPETYGYPSRSFQYMQAAKRITGHLEIEQPNGRILRERIDPRASQLEMVHEYDAHPEDIPGGLLVAQGTQLHPRYASNYHSGMPWELIFVDLDNGAQLMLGVLAFHETQKGTITPVVGQNQPTYRIMATLRLPDGTSVPLDNGVRVEHLNYRTLVGRVPTFMVSVFGIWKQSWDYRVTFAGGTVDAPDGRKVKVPPFDLGVTPQFDQSVPEADARGNHLTQRVPFVAAGSYNGCPARGFGWSELIINWYDKEERDPWYTGGKLPRVPKRCGNPKPEPPGGPQGALDPTFDVPPPNLTTQGCPARNPGIPECSYEAIERGGVGGQAPEPGGWTVKITRPGLNEPIVIRSLGGNELYACGTIKPGDKVEVVAGPGADVFAGDPAICF